MKLDLDWATEVPTRRKLLLGAGHLAALWAITFVQPLFDLLGKNPDFFVARDNTPGDILILSFAFMFLPPLVMLAVEFIATKIRPAVYYAVHFFFLCVIAAFLFVQIQANFYSEPTILLILLSLILGGLFAFAISHFVFLKSMMDILIVAPIVILLLFVFASDSSRVIFPKGEQTDIGATVEAKNPVVMLVLDELATGALMTREGELDAQRFPNFARLARESTWYPNHSTTSAFTSMAVPGILTGNIPAEGALPTASDQPDNIFSLLSGSYNFHVTELVTQICAVSLCPDEEKAKESQTSRLESLYSDLKYVEGHLVLPPRIADTLPDVGANFEGFGGGGGDGEGGKKTGTADNGSAKGSGRAGKVAKYPEFIDQIPARDSTMTMMHIDIPHQPWTYDVNGVEYNESPIDQLSEDIGPWVVDNNGVASAQQRQIVQTGFGDTLLGQIIDRLKTTGIWEKAMVIVAADHGISFAGGDVPRRWVDTRSMGEVANPPLFIKYPGQKTGRVDPAQSKTLDIVPTIAEELGVEGMYETEGVPLQDGKVPERDVTVNNTAYQAFSVPIEDVIQQRDAAIAERDRRFGTGPIYTLGPAPGLIGNAAPPVDGATEATLDRPEIWQNYVPGRGRVPIFINGALDGPEAGTLIAVGVNGRIRGTARSFEFEGVQRFGTLVNPDSLVAGRNEITVYSVGPGSRLTPLGSN